MVNKTRWSLGVITTALLLLTLFSQGAQALLLKIDQSASEVRYWQSPIFVCTFDPLSATPCELHFPDPQVFTISGDIEADVIHQHLVFGGGYPDVDRDLLSLQTMGLSSAALDRGFSLYGALGLMTGEAFEARDYDPCFLFVGPGSCSGWVSIGLNGSEGTWDGHTLIWTGHQSSLLDGFDYIITASAIPEPGSLPLMFLALPIMFFTLSGRSRALKAAKAKWALNWRSQQ